MGLNKTFTPVLLSLVAKVNSRALVGLFTIKVLISLGSS